MNSFEAEVLFRFTTVVPSAAAEALTALGLQYETIPTEDPDEDTAFGLVRGTTELDENELFAWLLHIIVPFNGDVVQWKVAGLKAGEQQ
jgi:hypothetical protein